MRALITGGGGFIGSNLVRALLRRGDDVRVIDDFSSGRRENLADAPALAGEHAGRFELIEGDVRDVETVRHAMEGREAVFHQAAIPSVIRSIQDPLSSHEVNVDGTLKLLLAARDAGVRRFVAASSSSIYGESEVLPKVETMPPDPISPYGLDKLAAETYCRLFTRLYGLQTVALRYFNVFGPRQDPGSEYSAVVPLFVTAIARGTSPTIYGTGQQTRDFTYIDNVVQANLCAAEAPESACGEAYNVACGERVSLIDLVERINRVIGESIEPVHAPPRPGDIQHSLADIDKLRSGLGYEPTVNFEHGLERTIEWFAPSRTTGKG
ncbi:MAG: SDR family oxidoreductase [Acidobacteriota bacterium]|nr:SDR family oxidoreductase [Acidobacteriota bacterium]